MSPCTPIARGGGTVIGAPAANDDAPAGSVAAEPGSPATAAGVVPFADRKRTRFARLAQPGPRQDYDDLVGLVRAEMARRAR